MSEPAMSDATLQVRARVERLGDADSEHAAEVLPADVDERARGFGRVLVTNSNMYMSGIMQRARRIWQLPVVRNIMQMARPVNWQDVDSTFKDVRIRDVQMLDSESSVIVTYDQPRDLAKAATGLPGAGESTASTPAASPLLSPDEVAARVAARANSRRGAIGRAFLGAFSVHAIRGTPFAHDMAWTRWATSTVIVETPSNQPLVSEESLFKAVRPYGRVMEVQRLENDPITKASRTRVQMYYTRSGVAVRHCLHGVTLDGATLTTRYVPFATVSRLMGFFRNSPRIAVPAATLALFGLGYLITDPIRVYSVKRRLSDHWDLGRAVRRVTSLRWVRETDVQRAADDDAARLGDTMSSGDRDADGQGDKAAAGGKSSAASAGWWRGSRVAKPDVRSVVSSAPNADGGAWTRALQRLVSGGDEPAESDEDERSLTWLMQDSEDTLCRWLAQPTSSRPMMVHGPRGSNKRSMLHRSLKRVAAGDIPTAAGATAARADGRTDGDTHGGSGAAETARPKRPTGVAHTEVVIDLAAMLSAAKSKDEAIDEIGEAVGLFPSLSAGKTLSGLVNAVAKAFGGVSAGAGEGSESHGLIPGTQKVLDCTTAALELLHAERLRTAAAARRGGDATRDDARHRTGLPVFVIAGVSEPRHIHNPAFREVLSWASVMSTRGLAKVVFLVNSSALVEAMRSDLPDVAFDCIDVADAEHDKAVDFVLAHTARSVGRVATPTEVEATRAAVGLLGKRVGDLLKLVRRMRDGVPANIAAEELVVASMRRVRTMLLGGPAALAGGAGDDAEGGRAKASHAWAPLQLWSVINNLASSKAGRASFDETVVTCCDGSITALRDLVELDIVAVGHEPGASRDHIEAASPVMLEALRRLCRDEELRPAMEDARRKAKLGKIDKEARELADEILRLQTVIDTGLYGSASVRVRRVADARRKRLAEDLAAAWAAAEVLERADG